MGTEPFDPEINAEKAVDEAAEQRVHEERLQKGQEGLSRNPTLQVTDAGKQIWQLMAEKAQKPGGPPHTGGIMIFADCWGRLMQGALGETASMTPEEITDGVTQIALECSYEASAVHPISGNIAGPAAGLLMDTWVHGEALRAWAKGPDSPWQRRRDEPSS